MKHLLLLGGGHSHIEVIRRFALQPPHQVSTTLVSPDRYTPYSGMLPGFVAGHYGFQDCHIDLERLCDDPNIAFRRSVAIGIDAAENRVRCEDGSVLDYDVLSIDIGSTPDTDSVPGAREYACRVKPVSGFISAWDRIIEATRSRQQLLRVAVVGGGAGGMELALAMHYRLHAQAGIAEFHLLSDAATILPGFPVPVRRIFERVLSERGISMHVDSRVTRVSHDMLYRETGDPLHADHIVWATSASAPRWLAAGGLKTDTRGFVEVNDALQSVSHARVFAAGDIASMVNHPRPKSGVYAVRQGPPLAENLRRALAGRPLVDYAPQEITLALISTGDKFAVASYGKLVLEGEWVWRWKDHIDRRFMKRYDRSSRKS